jgi:exodeoxyribonuclease VII large subunit
MSIFSVSELTSAIRLLLEPQFRGISVRGEISNFKAQASGHLYFSLKDAQAQISCALFRGSAGQLERQPKDGDQVIVKGELSIYPPRGNYQLIVRELQLIGVGELLLKLHQLKEKLAARGWFDPSHKKALPKLPARIGIVTSPTGAVIQDILQVLRRRFSHVSVLLNPVKVQGEGAAQEIAQAIEEMNRYQLADVLIVGRGGGSMEDLWAFNEEPVVRAVYESCIPVISAIGHETDVTLADFAADVRAPTPSAAAELAIAERANLETILQKSTIQSHTWIAQIIRERKQQVRALFMHPLLCQPHTLFVQQSLRLDDVTRQLELLRPSTQITLLRQRTEAYRMRLGEALDSLRKLLRFRREFLQQRSATFASLHPRTLLKKGFALLFSEKGDSLILSAKELRSSPSFIALLADGRVRATALEETTDGPHF